MGATAGTDPEGVAAEILAAWPFGTRWLRGHVRAHEPTLSLPQLHALGFVRDNPGASLSDLAGYLGIGLSTASTLVSRLVNAGYLHREEDPTERRRVLLSLTGTGQGRFDGALERARQDLARRLAELPERDLARISLAMARLRGIFSDGDGPGRGC
jgi:DNA-binding MarR family transcriptional regulator